MPGIVVFKRRWSVGSDDFVVPGIILLLLHTGWLVVLSIILSVMDFGGTSECMIDLYEHVLGYVVILSGCIVVEGFISWVGMRGTILYTAPRASMQYLLYVRLGIFLVELAWLIVGVVWIGRHYGSCPMGVAKKAVLGIIICNWCVLLSVLVTTWCTFDAAGRSWVKMKRYQRSLREGRAKFRYKRSGSGHRNWRQRKAMREYQNSWNKRCRLLFCCLGHSDRHRNSFAEIAKLLSEFFRDLDVVPSDVVAGMVLLRKFQQMERQMIVNQQKNDTYQFLSGVAITPKTKFLDINNPNVAKEVQTITHYLHYALAVYGWPMFMMVNSSTGCCQLCPYIRCYCLPLRQKRKYDAATVVEDNCCLCNYAALRKMCQLHNMEVVYATYHVEVGETPFFVAVDHEKRTVIVSIRGTLSLQDVITDLNAEGEHLPTEPIHDDWLGHKGMVQAAEYIRRKLIDEAILIQAFNYSPEKGTQLYDLVLVGHSLGAGTAAILAILLKQEYPNLVCYAYSPPGGLLSMPAVEYTKTFITSVVLGKDLVPRIGLHQMESLRSDLINAIKRSQDPKWKIILGGVLCCCPEELKFDLSDISPDKSGNRDVTCHPSDSSIALTVHQPLYPPGRIIHIVRNHPKKEDKKYENRWRRMVKKHEPVYQALWAGNTEFDEVLISPVMIQDHMPDKVLDALEKLLINTGPAKPQRLLMESECHQLLSPSADTLDSTLDRTPPHRLVLETSFTDLQPEGVAVEDIPSQGNMKHSLSWEYSSAVAAALDTSYQNQKRLQSLSVQPSSYQKVDLVHDEWMGSAPLASPETLSDVSSVSSKGSHQKLNNGNMANRLSWGGVPVMETIAQSPAVQRPTQDSLGVYENQISDIHKDNFGHVHDIGISRDSSTSNLLTNCNPQAVSTPLGHQVITEATVEMDPNSLHSNKELSLRSMDPSQLRLNIESLCQEAKTKHSGGDSTYASTSTERTIDRLFTPHEPKRVTFELSDSQESQETERDDSADSLYNSGESFVPTYPEYTTQQEYGNHLYSYARHSYNNHTPPTSPTIEHSFSDIQLTSLMSRPSTQHSHESSRVLYEPLTQKTLSLDTDTNISKTPISKHLTSPPPPTESSL